MQGKVKKLFSLENIGQRLFGCYLIYVFTLLLFFAPFFAYKFKKPASLLNPEFIPLAFLAGAGCCILIRFAAPKISSLLRKPSTFRAALILGTVVLLIVQAYIVKTCWFTTDWDVWAVTTPNAYEHAYYFSRYPNQLFLTGIFQRIINFCFSLGIDQSYLMLVVGSCFCVTASIALSALVGKKLGGYSVGYMVFLLGTLLIGLSPWILVPYSDTFGMLFTTLILWFYVCSKSKPLKWAGITFCTVIGYEIKPTIVLIVVAIVFLEIIAIVGHSKDSKKNHELRWHDTSRHEAIASSLAILISIALAFAVISKVESWVKIDEDQEFTGTHFLMMGFNPSSEGTWNASDVDFSAGIPTKDERQKANLGRWLERVDELGPLGIVNLFVHKTCINYSDGSFGWEKDGNYTEINGEGKFFKDYYGIDPDDTYGGLNVFEYPAQILWFTTLIGTLMVCFARKCCRKVSAICLSLFFLSVFITIFECNARYLFLYMPYFVLLGALGWHRFGRELMEKSSRVCGRKVGPQAIQAGARMHDGETVEMFLLAREEDMGVHGAAGFAGMGYRCARGWASGPLLHSHTGAPRRAYGNMYPDGVKRKTTRTMAKGICGP